MTKASVDLSEEDKKRLAYCLSDAVDLIDRLFAEVSLVHEQPKRVMDKERAALFELAQRVCPEEFAAHRKA